MPQSAPQSPLYRPCDLHSSCFANLPSQGAMSELVMLDGVFVQLISITEAQRQWRTDKDTNNYLQEHLLFQFSKIPSSL